jgi:signal transduction histidine kinase
MYKVEAADDEATAKALAENHRRAVTVTATLRLAAGVGFLVLGIVWTTSRQMSMGVLGIPLFVYVALASTFFTCGQNAAVQRMGWVMPFADTVFSLVIFHSALSVDAASAASWAVVSLAVYTLIVALAGLSLPSWLVAFVTATTIAAEAFFLHLAGHGVWPMLVAALALVLVAAATSTIQHKTLDSLRQSYETHAALKSLAEIRSQNQTLEQLEREKDSLLEVIVHDMRSPVGAAVLSLEYLVMELKRHPSQATLLEAADDGLATLNNLSGMISQILDTSKLETGRLTLRMDIAPMRPLIERSVHEVMARARSRGVTVDFEAPEEIRAAMDLRLLPRTFDVLLGYCLRRTPEGGRMLIATTSTATETRISLHSTAPAIPAAEREKVFDKFPAPEPEVRRKSSWGLGLYFCKLVLSSHQGTIAVEEVTGWPTTFVIRLPSVPKLA